jgi:hypothetical protein
MLHSTGGNMREAALREAQFQDMRRARGAADTQVQGMIDTYRNRGQQALGNVQGIGGSPLPYAALGQRQGAMLSGPAYGTASQLGAASDVYRQGANQQLSGYIGAGMTVASLGAMGMGMMGGTGVSAGAATGGGMTAGQQQLNSLYPAMGGRYTI